MKTVLFLAVMVAMLVGCTSTDPEPTPTETGAPDQITWADGRVRRRVPGASTESAAPESVKPRDYANCAGVYWSSYYCAGWSAAGGDSDCWACQGCDGNVEQCHPAPVTQ